MITGQCGMRERAQALGSQSSGFQPCLPTSIWMAWGKSFNVCRHLWTENVICSPLMSFLSLRLPPCLSCSFIGSKASALCCLRHSQFAEADGLWIPPSLVLFLLAPWLLAATRPYLCNQNCRLCVAMMDEARGWQRLPLKPNHWVKQEAWCGHPDSALLPGGVLELISVFCSWVY